MTIDIQPLTPTIGAEVRSVALADDLGPSVIAKLREALVEHQVLVFRDQDLTPESHIAFARRFGKIKMPPVATRHAGSSPEINVLDQVDPRGEGADNWHADNTYTETPPMGSLLRILKLPSGGGGDTAFASMYAAYEALSPPMRELCDGLRAVHDLTRSVTRAIARGHSNANLAELQRRFPPVEHPVVIQHPESGRPALFVNVNSTTRIVGMSEAESGMLLQFLFEHVKQPEFQLRVRWDTRSLVFLDNRCTQHYALADYRERRILHRVAIEGERPRGIERAAAGELGECGEYGVTREPQAELRTAGRCLCGDVRYEIEGRISPIFLCHCSKCRRSTGSAFHATALCRPSQFRFLSGEDGIRSFAESEAYVAHFCGRCGSPVPYLHEVTGQIALHVGGLETDPGRRVTHHLFVDSKAPWFEITDDLPQYAGHKPPKPPSD